MFAIGQRVLVSGTPALVKGTVVGDPAWLGVETYALELPTGQTIYAQETEIQLQASLQKHRCSGCGGVRSGTLSSIA